MKDDVYNTLFNALRLKFLRWGGVKYMFLELYACA